MSSCLRNRVHRGNLQQCVRREMEKLDINSRVLFSNTLTRQASEDLFFKVIKIFLRSQARPELVRQEHQVGSLNNCISELSATGLCLKIGITGRSTRIC